MKLIMLKIRFSSNEQKFDFLLPGWKRNSKRSSSFSPKTVEETNHSNFGEGFSELDFLKQSWQNHRILAEIDGFD